MACISTDKPDMRRSHELCTTPWAPPSQPISSGIVRELQHGKESCAGWSILEDQLKHEEAFCCMKSYPLQWVKTHESSEATMLARNDESLTLMDKDDSDQFLFARLLANSSQYSDGYGHLTEYVNELVPALHQLSRNSHHRSLTDRQRAFKLTADTVLAKSAVGMVWSKTLSERVTNEGPTNVTYFNPNMDCTPASSEGTGSCDHPPAHNYSDDHANFEVIHRHGSTVSSLAWSDRHCSMGGLTCKLTQAYFNAKNYDASDDAACGSNVRSVVPQETNIQSLEVCEIHGEDGVSGLHINSTDAALYNEINARLGMIRERCSTLRMGCTSTTSGLHPVMESSSQPAVETLENQNMLQGELERSATGANDGTKEPPVAKWCNAITKRAPAISQEDLLHELCSVGQDTGWCLPIMIDHEAFVDATAPVNTIIRQPVISSPTSSSTAGQESQDDNMQAVSQCEGGANIHNGDNEARHNAQLPGDHVECFRKSPSVLKYELDVDGLKTSCPAHGADVAAVPASAGGAHVDTSQNIAGKVDVVESSCCKLESPQVGDEAEVDSSNRAREMMFRVAAYQPIDWGSIMEEVVGQERPKRKNVRISNDPQSVAARRRRKLISNRIRILQRLVPGGTKLDMASMLDEAIHYLKFLKLQVKTLRCLHKYVLASSGVPASIASANNNASPFQHHNQLLPASASSNSLLHRS